MRAFNLRFLNLAAALLAAAGLVCPATGQSSSAGAASALAEASGSSFNRPQVAPLKRSFEFRNLPEIEPSVDLKIRSPEGKPLYRLLCHSEDYKGGPDLQYTGESGDFAGVLGCHLSHFTVSASWGTFSFSIPWSLITGDSRR